MKHSKVFLPQGTGHTDQEKQKSAQLVSPHWGVRGSSGPAETSSGGSGCLIQPHLCGQETSLGSRVLGSCHAGSVTYAHF